MAGKKGSKYFDIFLNYKLWLESKSGKSIVGDGKVQLLSLIREHGSLSEAAEKMGISYRKAWGDLKQAEKLIGFSLTEMQRGGKNGGKTALTSEGEILVDAFDKLHQEIDKAIHQVTKSFFHQINKTDEQ